MLNIIEKKVNKQSLTEDEIKFVLDNYLNGSIPDYQMSAFLMAILLNGMTDLETIYLTKWMINSGDTVDLSFLGKTIVDKHSTGGVGDKTTLVLAPLVASLGLPVAKMSGRGLGHTGGTIDKLESIEGFKVSISNEEFKKQMEEIGVCIASQTKNLVPADKKIYALRDVTGTTMSIPLIASSIMSKKIASGASIIVIDVKVGNGALMKDIEDARKLANLMIKIGKHYEKKVVCILTNMDEPLGYAIGNGLEVKESIDTLKNQGPKDLKRLVLSLASHMVSYGKNIPLETARKECLTSLENGKAYEKFEQLVKWQNGDLEKIKISDRIISVKSIKTGFIQKIDAYKLGNLAKKLGAGRSYEGEEIDYGVGFLLSKKVGDYVVSNEELLKVYMNEKDLSLKEILDCFTIDNTTLEDKPLILDVIE